MNIELMRRVRDAIAAEPDRFDLRSVFDGTPAAFVAGECGTTACIAGWAAVLSGWVEAGGYVSRASAWDWATQALGLQASWLLFTPGSPFWSRHAVDGYMPTTAEAVAALDALIAGESLTEAS